jgi:predicted esterase
VRGHVDAHRRRNLSDIWPNRSSRRFQEGIWLRFPASCNLKAKCNRERPILRGVKNALTHLVWIVLLAIPAWSQQGQSSASTQIVPGTVTPSQSCAAKPEQSYALYLPSHYSPNKKWPIVYVFDPDARGEIPVKLMQDAAERFGYLVVGSNNSRNGSWKMETDAAQAMWNDTHTRFAIDDRAIYFAGFSGGARVAAALAQSCKCAAGVLLSGAGFPGVPPSRDVVFPVYAAVGVYDFNYPELADLDEKLEAAGFPHVLRHFDGTHQWAPAEVMTEAFAWFELMAMKQNRERRDETFIASQQKEALARAQALEHSGDSYNAWREYRYAAATFDGLADTAALRQGAGSLAQQKAVLDGQKREKEEAKEQEQLVAGIEAGMMSLRRATSSGTDSPSQLAQQRGAGAPSAPQGNDASRSDIFHETERQIVSLRNRTSSEKNQDRLRVDRRALAGIFIAAGEFGDESADAKNFDLARQYYQLAVDASPASLGALRELAKAQALCNDRKGSLKTLHQAKEADKDSTSFSAWLNDEPAFAKLRQDPQFRALTNP